MSPARPVIRTVRLSRSERIRTSFGRKDSSESAGRYGVVKVNFRLPGVFPLAPFFRAHPWLLAKCVAAQNLANNRYVTEFELLGDRAAAHAEEMARQAGVISVALLADAGVRALYRVVLRQPRHVSIANELRAVFRFPRFVQDGRYTAEVAPRASQIRRLVQELRRFTPEVRVLRFGREILPTYSTALTPKQVVLLHHAREAGYFEVPRRISLTRLAEKLGRSKAGVSRALALAERELVEAWIAASG